MKVRTILGVTAFNHDSSACIIHDNKVIAFAEEERFNGVKHTNVFPSRAIDYCLKEANITRKDITDVAYYFNLNKCISSYIKHNNPLFFLVDPTVFFRKRFYYEIVWLLDFINRVHAIKKHLNNPNIKMHYIDHHIAHTWYGYYSSGFDKCIVLSNDSVGEDVSTLATEFIKDEKGIHTKELIKQYDPNSLGYLYGAITEFLGFTRGEGEGRVMALASFGTNAFVDLFKKGVQLLPNGVFKLTKELVINRNFQIKGYRLGKPVRDAFGNPRINNEEITQKHYDIATGLQQVFELIVDHQLTYLTQLSNKIVITGGVAQNSVMNGKATDKYTETEFFIPPITYDAGCSLGAALYTYYLLEKRLPPIVDTAFLGPKFTNEEIIKSLDNNKISYTIMRDPVAFCVKELANNKVIGIFRDRMECGPRALCNRSILANPADPKMRNYLNNNVKYRESFRPYGGFMKPENIDRLLVHKNKYKEGPYMSFVYEVKADWKDKIPSLVHIDGTCRVQIINNQDGGFLKDLLEKFEHYTGVPIIINTSMNLRGYPIARTPAEALSTFYTSGIDYLLFNNSILVKK